MRSALLLFVVLASGATHAPAAPPVAPGCEIQRELVACMEDVGNAAEMRRCVNPAREAARTELERVVAQARARMSDSAELLAAFERAQTAWEAFHQSDCDAVGVDWQGGSMQGPVFSQCVYEHTLRRAQALWLRHVAAEDGALLSECRPE